MTSELQQAKRPVSTLLAGPYGHPLHPLLVSVPIGAWVAALVFDVASHLVADPAPLAHGALWLVGIGVLGAVAAALVGFLDLLAIAPGTRAHRTALAHMTINLVVTAGFLGDFLWRRAVPADEPTPAGPLALTVLCLAGLAVGGFLGGKLAFRYGVRVADEGTQAEGHVRI